MKNINIQLEDELYWKLKELKSTYRARSWSDLLKVVLSILNGLGDKNA